MASKQAKEKCFLGNSLSFNADRVAANIIPTCPLTNAFCWELCFCQGYHCFFRLQFIQKCFFFSPWHCISGIVWLFSIPPIRASWCPSVWQWLLHFCSSSENLAYVQKPRRRQVVEKRFFMSSGIISPVVLVDTASRKSLEWAHH